MDFDKPLSPPIQMNERMRGQLDPELIPLHFPKEFAPLRQQHHGNVLLPDALAL